MNVWSNGYCLNRAFRSPFSAADCCRLLRDTEPTFGDSLNPNLFEVRQLANGGMLLILKGKRFSKAIRTQYLMAFSDGPAGCVITLNFHQELLGMPPITSEAEILQFMEEKLRATPIIT